MTEKLTDHLIDKFGNNVVFKKAAFGGTRRLREKPT